MARKRGDTKRNGEESSGLPARAPAAPRDPVSGQEAAEYIASLLEGLKVLAHQAQLPFLAYLLGMALEEAKTEKTKHN